MAKDSTNVAKPSRPRATRSRSASSGSTSTPTLAPRAKSTTPVTDDQIRQRAYEIFLARNGGPGDASSDWAQAERELHQKTKR